MIDSKEMRESLAVRQGAVRRGHDAEVFSWDDASDNRYLASGVACWIHDAISAYRTTEDTNPPVFKNTFIAHEPEGPRGKRVSVAAPNVWMVLEVLEEPAGGKEFLGAPHRQRQGRHGPEPGYNMPF